MKQINFLILFVLLAVLLVPVTSASAQTPQPQPGGVLFGTNYTLRSDETLNGDLVVFGGNVTIEKGSVVNGDLVVIGGTITSDSRMNGDVVAVGGQVTLDENAYVSGDVVTVGGQVNRAAGAQVKGQVVNNVPAPQINVKPPTVPNPPNVPGPGANIVGSIAKFFGALILAVVVSAFATLLGLFLQPQFDRVSQAIVAQPFIAGSFGLLATFLAIILFFTIVPLVGVAFAWLFGVIAIGYEVGQRMTRSMNQTWSPALTAGFGTFLLMIVVAGIGMLPCVGGLVQILIGLIGIGGVAMTWFGSRPYPMRAAVAAPVMPASTDAPLPPTS